MQWENNIRKLAKGRTHWTGSKHSQSRWTLSKISSLQLVLYIQSIDLENIPVNKNKFRIKKLDGMRGLPIITQPLSHVHNSTQF